MNPRLPTVAWSNAGSPVNLSPTSQEAAPQVRTAVSPEKAGAADTYRRFQDFLAERAGKRVTVIVQEAGKEQRFRFEVPKNTSN